MQRTITITSKRRSTARALSLIAITAAAAICAPRLAVAGVNTWTPLGPAGGRIADVEFSPSVQGELYLAAMSGFHRSTLAGASWTLTRENFGSRPIDVAVDPSNPDRVLLVTLDGLFVSNDHGATFVQRANAGHAGVAVETSSDGGTLYFASSTRLYRSVDRGDSWTERTPPPFTNDDRGERVRALAVDPTDPAVLYVSVLGVGLFSSVNGGDSWQQIGTGIPALAQTLSLEIDPSNRLRLLAATVEGLHLSNDGGVTWSDTSLQTLVSDIDVDPADPNVIFATVLAGQIFKSIDGGATFNPLPISVPVFEDRVLQSTRSEARTSLRSAMGRSWSAPTAVRPGPSARPASMRRRRRAWLRSGRAATSASRRAGPLRRGRLGGSGSRRQRRAPATGAGYRAHGAGSRATRAGFRRAVRPVERTRHREIHECRRRLDGNLAVSRRFRLAPCRIRARAADDLCWDIGRRLQVARRWRPLERGQFRLTRRCLGHPHRNRPDARDSVRERRYPGAEHWPIRVPALSIARRRSELGGRLARAIRGYCRVSR